MTSTSTRIDWTKVSSGRAAQLLTVLSLLSDQEHTSATRLCRQLERDQLSLPMIVASVNAFGRANQLGPLIEASMTGSRAQLLRTIAGTQVLDQLRQ